MTGPLTAVDLTVICDGPHQHEVRFITDGRTAYAYGLGWQPSAARLPSRVTDTPVITAICGQPLNADRLCEARVEVSLDTEGAWTADELALDLLARNGERIDA